MKYLLILLGIIITCNHLANCQSLQPTECATPFISSSNNSCLRQSNAFINVYEDFYNTDLSFWIPNSTTPIKIVKINFIIVQKSDGSGNFSSTGTGCFGISHETFITNIIDEVNAIYSNLDDPSDNSASLICGTCNQIKDTRIRFAIQGFHYFQDDTEWGIPSTYYSYNSTSELNIYLPNTTLNYSYVNELPNYDLSTNIHFMYNRFYSDYNFDCTIAFNNAVQTMVHELGHVIGLNHTHLTGIGTCSNMYNNGWYFDDVFGTYPGNCPDLGNWQSNPLSSPNDGITNNIMGNTLGRKYLSTKQIAAMNRNLSLKTCRNFLLNCPISINNNYSITNSEVWDFDFLADRNIFIDNNSTLTLECKLNMPPGTTITVNTGCTLEVNGTITDYCNAGWDGQIHVKTGGILHLLSNANIRCIGNGKIIIDDDPVNPGKIIYDLGAKVYLNSPNSVIEINGVLELSNNAVLRLDYQGSNHGYFKFGQTFRFPSKNIFAGNNCSIEIYGSSQNSKILQINQETFYAPANLATFSITNAKVELNAGSRIQASGINTNINFNMVKFTSTTHATNNGHRGFHYYGQPNTVINNCIFENGEYGIFAYSTYGGAPLNVLNTVFRNNTIGIKSYDKGLNLYNCYLLGNQSGAVSTFMSFPSENVDGIVNASQKGLLWHSYSTGSLTLDNPNINHNDVGVFIGSAPLGAKCGTVSFNNTGFHLRNGATLLMDYLIAQPVAAGVTAIQNNITIQPSDANFLYLHKGYNDLTPSGLFSNAAINGTLIPISG